jgi:hypothetical protein
MVRVPTFIADIGPNNESGQDIVRRVLRLNIDTANMKARTVSELEKT